MHYILNWKDWNVNTNSNENKQLFMIEEELPSCRDSGFQMFFFQNYFYSQIFCSFIIILFIFSPFWVIFAQIYMFFPLRILEFRCGTHCSDICKLHRFSNILVFPWHHQIGVRQIKANNTACPRKSGPEKLLTNMVLYKCIIIQ